MIPFLLEKFYITFNVASRVYYQHLLPFRFTLRLFQAFLLNHMEPLHHASILGTTIFPL